MMVSIDLNRKLANALSTLSMSYIDLEEEKEVSISCGHQAILFTLVLLSTCIV